MSSSQKEVDEDLEDEEEAEEVVLRFRTPEGGLLLEIQNPDGKTMVNELKTQLCEALDSDKTIPEQLRIMDSAAVEADDTNSVTLDSCDFWNDLKQRKIAEVSVIKRSDILYRRVSARLSVAFLFGEAAASPPTLPSLQTPTSHDLNHLPYEDSPGLLNAITELCLEVCHRIQAQLEDDAFVRFETFDGFKRTRVDVFFKHMVTRYTTLENGVPRGGDAMSSWETYDGWELYLNTIMDVALERVISLKPLIFTGRSIKRLIFDGKGGRSYRMVSLPPIHFLIRIGLTPASE